MDNINWLSMGLSTITPIVIGYIYYHKALFGKTLMSSIGAQHQTLNPVSKAVFIGVSLVFSFLLSFFLLNFCNDGINQEGDFDNFQHGAWHGGFIAITIVTPVVLINALFQPKAWKHILINILYWFITLALMSGMLDAMNHWKNVVI